VQTLFGPTGIGANRAQLSTIIDGIQPNGGTDIFDGLQTGYKAALSVGDETQQRRVIFLTDGLPTAGDTNVDQIKAMSAGFNDQHIGLTTIGLGADVDAGLLRDLSEQGGGNFYFVEQPAAGQEVFTQELAFFVAPIAYDLELSIDELPAYTVKQVYGTNLWRASMGGGQVRIPSVFLTSRTSSMPDSTGGRRGGGSAIMAELSPTPAHPTAGQCDVANLHLRYRQPGQTEFQTQDAAIAYQVGDETASPDGFYSTHDIEKNTIILDLFVALRDATAQAAINPRGARDLLAAFQPKFKLRIAGWADADLIDDITILQQYIDVLNALPGVAGTTAPSTAP
jgi:Ca-activated chloride channel family protein